MKTVVGLFDTFGSAQRAVQDLEDSGITRDNISLVARKADGQFTDFINEETTDTGYTIASDAGTGAIIGGTAGLIMALTGLVVPGFGPVVAAGWLISTLTGAAIGAAAGGLFSALVNAGVPELDAAAYNEGVERGGTLVAIRAEDAQTKNIATILDTAGAVDIDERAATWKQDFSVERSTPLPATASPFTIDPTTVTGYPAPATAQAAGASAAPPTPRPEASYSVREPGDEQEHDTLEQTGLPTAERQFHSEERDSVQKKTNNADFVAFQKNPQEIMEPSTAVVATERSNANEDVILGITVTDHIVAGNDAVRLTQENDSVIPSDNWSGDWASFESYSNDFHNNWQLSYGNSGTAYEEYEPAYRYGYALRNNPAYRGKDWNAIENEVMQDWNQHNGDTWERFRGSIRYAWVRVTSSIQNGNQTGGQTADGSPDTRGISEKVADAVTGDRIDDKTSKAVL